jgi:diadenosine tetraphosphate (Ap4A) HIT family hydrolase
MKIMDKNCDFCNEFSGGQDNTFARLYRGTLDSRVLLSTPNFHVFPSIGQIVEGYLLASPIGHYRAVSDIPASMLQEFGKLHEDIRLVVNEAYGPCISYEHGVRFANAGGCGISHAHFHTLPLIETLEPLAMLKSKFRFRRMADLAELPELAANVASYLMYQDLQGCFYFFDTNRLPSQYMRQVLGELLGSRVWDWRTAGREERLYATFLRLYGSLNSKWMSEDVSCF